MDKVRLTLMLMLMLASAPLVGCRAPVAVPPVAAFSEEGAYLPGRVGPGAIASPNSLIQDVPMPVGFEAVASRSTSKIEDGLRLVKHVYQGRADGGEVVMMYRRSLERYNWGFVGREQLEDGSTVLRFEKGREALRVHVGERWGVTTVLVEIAPKAVVG